MAEIRVYPCRDGIHRSLYPDLRDCPETAAIATGLTGGGTRTRFLGARGRLVSEEEAAFLTAKETPEPSPIDRKRLLYMGLYAFLGILFLVLLTRRRNVRRTR